MHWIMVCNIHDLHSFLKCMLLGLHIVYSDYQIHCARSTRTAHAWHVAIPDLLYIIMCCQDCTLAIETTRFIVHMCTCATRTAHICTRTAHHATRTAHVSSCQLFIALSHNATTGTSFMKTLKLSYHA